MNSNERTRKAPGTSNLDVASLFLREFSPDTANLTNGSHNSGTRSTFFSLLAAADDGQVDQRDRLLDILEDVLKVVEE